MSEFLTSRERILAAIRWKPVDRLPVFIGSLLVPHLVGRKLDQSFLRDPEALAESAYLLWERFGVDLITTSGAGRVLDTLVKTNTIYPEDDLPQYGEPVITTHAQADRLIDGLGDLSVLDQDVQVQAAVEAIRLLKKRVGEDVMLSAVVPGPLGAVSTLCGPELVMRNIVKDPELIHKLLRLGTRLAIGVSERLIAAGVEIIWSPDAMASSSCISPKQHEEFALPYHTEQFAAAHEAGAIVMQHPCGEVYPKLDQLYKNKADVFHFTELADLSVVQKIFVQRHAVAGGVSVVGPLFLGTPEEVDRTVKELIATLKFKTGVLIGPSCGLGANIPLENLKAMADAVKKYGQGTLRQPKRELAYA